MIESRLSLVLVAVALFFGVAFAGPAALAADSKSTRSEKTKSTAMQSLDEQVQEVKADVLAIAAELDNLEERLLYPSDTQVAVFVSFESGEAVALDSAQISIDGELVATHIYTFKELEALRKGGVQRIYTGNVRTGEHRLEVAVAGKRGSKDFGTTQSFVFDKQIAPKLLGVTLAAGSSGDTAISIEGW